MQKKKKKKIPTPQTPELLRGSAAGHRGSSILNILIIDNDPENVNL